MKANNATIEKFNQLSEIDKAIVMENLKINQKIVKIVSKSKIKTKTIKTIKGGENGQK